MSQISISHCTVAELFAEPNIATLLDEYAAESALDELGGARPHLDMYQQMESAGVLRMLAAHRDGQLIGFLTLIVSTLPHFSRRICSTESYFVSASERRHGVGLKLLHAAEGMAHECGAAGLFVSAPTGGRLEQVLPHAGYRETNRVYFRGLP